MKIELQKWALVAEVLGGIAVVATLIFLVLETRANTNAIQAQTYHALTAELNEVRRENSTQEMTEIYRKYEVSGLESLSNSESHRFLMNAEAKWGVYESAFYARERDVLGDDEWLRFDMAICRNYLVDKAIWVTQSKGLQQTIGGLSVNVTPKFKKYVEGACKG